MIKRKIGLIIGLMFAFSSVGNASIQSVKPDIKSISFWNGKWHISYDEMKNGINLLKEELLVDGNSDRIVPVGTGEKRGFSLHGSYSADTCHKATIVMYDRENKVVSKSDEFEFGDTSKCTTPSSDLKILDIVSYGINTWHIDYKDVAVSTAYSVEKLYVDGVEDRTVNAGTTDARLRRGFSVHGAYTSDECHTAYLELYDNNGVKVKTSESFKFGNLHSNNGSFQQYIENNVNIYKSLVLPNQCLVYLLDEFEPHLKYLYYNHENKKVELVVLENTDIPDAGRGGKLFFRNNKKELVARRYWHRYEDRDGWAEYIVLANDYIYDISVPRKPKLLNVIYSIDFRR